MKFADSQQRLDLLAALRRLRLLASHHELDDRAIDDLTLAELGVHVAELRNIEQILLSIYQEREQVLKPVPVPREKRDLGETIDRMLAVIPKGETHLRASLEKVKADDGYVAPEMRAVSWAKAQGILRAQVGDPEQDWEKRIAAIWRGEP